MLYLVNDFEEFHYDTETPAFLLLDLVRKSDKKLVDILPPGFVSSPRPHHDSFHSVERQTIGRDI